MSSIFQQLRHLEPAIFWRKSLHDATEPGGHGSLVRVDTGKKLLTTGKKIKVHPYSPNWKENLRHWGKT
jgi:hypothetical protein